MKIRIRKTDALFSKYLRAKRPKCERCGRTDGLQVSHFWGRRFENTRFSEINCDVLCFRCHQGFHESPGDYRDWKAAKLGEVEYKKLMIAKEMYKKRNDAVDMLALQQLVKESKLDI